MADAFPSSHGAQFEAALDTLADRGVLKLEGRFRDGHVEAIFPADGVDISGSRLTHRELTEQHRLRLLGWLIIAAADNGIHPADALAIGMAELLGKAAPPA
ncbi:MAG: hypothetical protein ABW203_07515 [Novosphingobium sp.]